jgi:ribonucleoside-diphosphate reductase alpha chain
MKEPRLSENALRVLEARYLRRDSGRRIIETPRELFERVAKAVGEAELSWGSSAQASRWREEFTEILVSLDFLPNSPTLMNAGTPMGQLSACFVLPVEDSMEGIFNSLKYMALVQQTGGGTGFSFSRLRPKGDTVEPTGGEASGPVSFMKIFDCATENIKQGGKRRGANMGILRVDHPDILEFISSKRDETAFRNFNLSVAVTDLFMEAVRRNEDYSLVHPRTRKPAGTLRAPKVFQQIVDAAWSTGDPGLVFLDAINRANPTPQLGAMESTNPCGEIPLLPYESCNLASINLAHMLQSSGNHPEVDWERLRGTVRNAVRFLDNVIEVNSYPIPEIERISRSNRKIGLGVMGFAEMLIELGIPYDSDGALRLAEELMRVIDGESLHASQKLAEERGVFSHWKESIYAAKNLKVRNAARTAIAPTGTISIIADTSASIEPLFALAYRRSHVLGDQTLYSVNPVFLKYLENKKLKGPELFREIVEKGQLRNVKGLPEETKRLFVTALEIPVERHLQIQAAFQRHIDNSVSKTINLPQEAVPEDVAFAYQRAWEMGLKGITLYRYGSKSAQVLELGAHQETAPYDYGSKCDPEECKV